MVLLVGDVIEEGDLHIACHAGCPGPINQIFDLNIRGSDQSFLLIGGWSQLL